MRWRKLHRCGELTGGPTNDCRNTMNNCQKQQGVFCWWKRLFLNEDVYKTTPRVEEGFADTKKNRWKRKRTFFFSGWKTFVSNCIGEAIDLASGELGPIVGNSRKRVILHFYYPQRLFQVSRFRNEQLSLICNFLASLSKVNFNLVHCSFYSYYFCENKKKQIPKTV